MMNHIWIIWLIVGAILAVSEIFTPTFFLLPIGIGCFLASLVSYFTPLSLLYISFLVFIISSVIMLLFIRPICIKYLYSKNAPKSNVDAMIGKVCIAQSDITSIPQGTVKIYSDIWKAQTEDEDGIKAGDKVEIVRIDGNVLIVKKI